MKSPPAIVFLTVVIDLLGFGIVMPLLPLYAKGLEADNLTIGLFMASFSAMQFLFSPVWGRISDRIGRRPVLLIGLAGSAVFYALFGWATAELSLLWLFVARIGAGISGANIAVAQAVIADVTPPDKRAKGMALVGAAFGIGFTFGPLLGAMFVSDLPADFADADRETIRALLSPSVGYLAAGLSAAAFLLGAVLLPETLRPDAAPHRPRTWLDLNALRTAAATPTLGLLVMTFFLATFAFGHFEGVLARVTVDVFGWSLRDNFYGFAAIGFILALAQGVLVRRLAPRLGEVVLAVTGTLLMTAGLAGLGWGVYAGQMPVIMAVLPLLVIGFAFLTPSVQALISRRTDADKQGAILGLNQSASAMARILGPALGNIVYDVLPAHTAPFVIGSCLMAAAFLLTLRIASIPVSDRELKVES
jgi:MFS family permease